MCGEHKIHFHDTRRIRGSSPHVRGAPPRWGVLDCEHGIIPACAGSTPYGPLERLEERDHPRMCGEHTSQPAWTAWRWGSSPHVRGAPTRNRQRNTANGIIPACAGSTGTSLSTGASSRDHPRMCGEHVKHLIKDGSVWGSSPHVRGALWRTGNERPSRGIIPACAGSTVITLIASLVAGDHPRMCGEHGTNIPFFISPPGSSPHVRGARCTFPILTCSNGIIPACAGSTLFYRY